MNDLTRSPDGFEIDANYLSDAFGLSEADLKIQMRDGHITTISELGTNIDAGRWRITFYYGAFALQLIVDCDGKILSKTIRSESNRSSRF